MKPLMIATITAGFMAGGFAAHASDSEPESGTSGIGVAWAGKSGMAKRVLAGFEERMSEVAPDWQIDVNGELADATALADAHADFVARYGAAVVLRSNGSRWLAENAPSAPTFIGGGNYPPSLGVVENMTAPEGNITGVTYYLEPIVVLETLSALHFAESLLFIQQTGHPGTDVERATFPTACDDLFIECSFVDVAGPADIAGAIEANTGFDAIIIGNQAPLFDDAAAFEAALTSAGQTPIMGLSSQVAKVGGLAALSANDHTLGRMLADTVIAVVRDGQAVAATPVGTDHNPTLVLNQATADRLGIAVPRQMLEAAELVGTNG